MRIKLVETKDSIKLLTDPQPNFMALVDHGANQTPFATVKHVGKPKRQETGMKGKGAKAPESRLTKMQFSKAKFPTAKAVADWLTENDIEGAGDPELVDDVWIVNSAEDFTSVKLGKARSTATKHDGVTAFIAPVEGADPGDEDEPDGEGEEVTASAEGGEEEGEEGEEGEEPTAAKGATKVKLVDGEKTGKTVRKPPAPKKAAAEEPTVVEPVLAMKFDWWSAYSSDGESLMDVLEDGMEYDNVPPGMDEVLLSAAVTIANVLSDNGLDPSGKLAALEQMGTELASVTMGLFNLFSQATDDATKALKPDVRKAAKAYSESFSESVARMSEGKLTASVDNVDNVETTGKGAAKEFDADAIAEAAAKAVNKIIGPRLDNVEKAMARAPARKSMSESIEELVDVEERDEKEEANALIAKNMIRRNFGLPALTV